LRLRLHGAIAFRTVGAYHVHPLNLKLFILSFCLLPFALCFSFFLLPALTSGDWDPLGADCGSNKSCLKPTEMYTPECPESTTKQSKQTKAFFCCSNQAISG